MKKGILYALLALSVSGVSFGISIREALDAGAHFDIDRTYYYDVVTAEGVIRHYDYLDIGGKPIKPVSLLITTESEVPMDLSLPIDIPSGGITDLYGLSDIEGIDNVNKLSLYLIKLKSIPSNAFKGLENILSLNVNYCETEHVDKNAFSGLDKLWQLDLSRNKIRTIHKDTFKGLTSLHQVDLYGNPISKKNISVLKKLYPNIEFITYETVKEYVSPGFYRKRPVGQ